MRKEPQHFLIALGSHLLKRVKADWFFVAEKPVGFSFSNLWRGKLKEKTISGSLIVDKISKMHINSIPESWYKKIRQKKTPHAMAILVLWDLLYWYKWTEIRDEETGNILGFRKKFKADLLQRSYSAIADKFGISKSNAADIIYFLEQLGVLKRVFRTITIGDTKMGNVLFIELIPEKIKEISEFTTDDFSYDEEELQEENSIPIENKLNPSGEISPEVSGKFLQTNTTITQSNSQSNSHTHTENACVENSITKNIGDLQKQMYSAITEHNINAQPERRIAVSPTLLSFCQKEFREMLDVIGTDVVKENPSIILESLTNYLEVAMSNTWKKSFSLRSFFKNYLEFSPQFFSMSKYIDLSKDSTEPGKRPQDLFYFAMKDNPRFNANIFRKHWSDWLKTRPSGENYFKWQSEWENTNAY